MQDYQQHPLLRVVSDHFFLLLCCSVRDFEQSSIVVMFLKHACRNGKSLFGSEHICSLQRHLCGQSATSLKTGGKAQPVGKRLCAWKLT